MSGEPTDHACALRSADPDDIFAAMNFHKIWVEQCRATRTIKRRFGVKNALDY